MQWMYLTIALAPLVAAVVAGLFGRLIGRAGAHSIAIAGVAVSCALSIYVLKGIVADGVGTFDGPVYTWLISDGVHIEVGFLIDRLSAMMMAVVTFVSLMVHIYTIGYMSDDDGLSAILQLHLTVHVRDADAGDVEQLHAIVLRLGRGRRGVVPAHRLSGTRARRRISPPSRHSWSIASAISDSYWELLR